MKRNFHHQKWFRIWAGFTGIGLLSAPSNTSATYATDTPIRYDSHTAQFTLDAEGSRQVVHKRDIKQVRVSSVLIALSGVHERVLSYPFSQVWPTAIRYLRVDQHYKLSDKDKKAGFILFRYPVESEVEGEGSIELIEIVDAAKRPSVKIIVRMSHGPHHLAFTVAKGISDKIRKERGQPAPPPSTHPPTPKPPKDPPNKKPSIPPSMLQDKTKSISMFL